MNVHNYLCVNMSSDPLIRVSNHTILHHDLTVDNLHQSPLTYSLFKKTFIQGGDVLPVVVILLSPRMYAFFVPFLSRFADDIFVFGHSAPILEVLYRLFLL